MTYPTPRTQDPDLIHASTRTYLATNADMSGKQRTLLRVTRLTIGWEDGDVTVRFAAHETDVTPRRQPVRRTMQR